MSEPAFSWDAACAAAWGKWFHILETAAQPLSDRMVALAGIEPGHRVLDIATGLGEPAITAARRVGPEGSVLAIDLSPEMLALGRQRAEALGLANIAFQHMDAQALDLPDRSLDAVLCRWGLMFVPDLARTLAGIRRCLTPGGRIAAAVWGPAELAPAISLSARVIHKSLGLPPPDEGALTPFAFSDVETLLGALTASGFSDVQGEWLALDFVFESAETFTAFRRDRSKPLQQKIADYPEEQREAAWDAVTEAARAYVAADGAIRMKNKAFCASAQN